MANNPAQQSDTPRKTSSGAMWLRLLVVLLAIFLLRARQRVVQTEGELMGRPLPPLQAAGWWNAATPPSDESVRAKVVLLDFWFAECPPCRAAMPHMVDIHKRFGGQGLVVIGLTPDNGPDLPASKGFIDSVPGVTWPIGYGADVPIDMLGINGYPTLILFDKSGK